MTRSLKSQFRFVAVLSLIVMGSADFSAGQNVDFSADIQPIFAQKCLACHGADKAEGGLRLDSETHAFRKTDSGTRAIVPQAPSESELLNRVQSDDPDKRMPPEGKPLAPEEIQLLKNWIAQGAHWDEHWAYRELDAGVLPDVKHSAWCRNEIDRFVLVKLESRDIEPSGDADPTTLIRRLYLDLIGLPPTVEQVDRFVHDESPDAYLRLVERLLASPHFGERWGRHWLDKARYADSDGYEKDRNRPNAWRYRDWVIHAINSDQPFDQFTAEQLGGDVIPNASKDQILATAFHRQTLTNTEGGTDQEQWRVAAVMDRTETLGTVWLGLSVGCARCHNHKYDQITQKEYYQLFAYFNNGDEVNENMPGPKWQQERFIRRKQAFDSEIARQQRQYDVLKMELGNNQQAWEKRLADCQSKHLTAEIQSLIALKSENRTDEQKAKLTAFYDSLKQQAKQQDEAIQSQKKNAPRPPSIQTRVIGERQDKRRTTHILRRGEFKQPLEPVTAATVASLSKSANEIGQGRLDLANWLVGGENPIVPRVTVNQIWQHLFGHGIVRTPNDFGVRGEPPTHPKLLDFLATEYLRLGWSRKSIIRTIVLSSTYRQSSVHRPSLSELDPTNRWLYRQNRFRVEAEIIRDMALSASGLLARRIGGPSVFPPMPPEAAAVSYANNFKWNVSQGADRYRRGIYTFFKRTAPHPTLTTFDCPDANVTNVQRNRSNTPIGALVLLNNEVYREAAVKLALQLIRRPDDDETRLRYVYRTCISRFPTDDEIVTLKGILQQARLYYRAKPDDARKLVGKLPLPLVVFSDNIDASLINNNMPSNLAQIEVATWTVVVRVLLNLDAFVTRE